MTAPDATPDPSPEPGTPVPARVHADRRERPTPMLTRYLLRGRRRGGRRDGESERIYVDHPGAFVIGAFVALTTLSIADAWFTLHELSIGATEANPVMQAALELGNGPFVIIKTVVTLVGAGFLALHKNWPLGRRCLMVAVVGYAALTVYHLCGVFLYLPQATG